MFVKELAASRGWSVALTKTVYDCVSLAVAAVLSLAFFGSLQGIGVGTAVCALIYGVLIRWFDRGLSRFFVFENKAKVRKEYE